MIVNFEKTLLDAYKQNHIDLENTLLDLLSVVSRDFCQNLNLQFIEIDPQNTIQLELNDALVFLLKKNFTDDSSYNKIINILGSVGLMFGGRII